MDGGLVGGIAFGGIVGVGDTFVGLATCGVGGGGEKVAN